jgi:hypothetical protein
MKRRATVLAFVAVNLVAGTAFVPTAAADPIVSVAAEIDGRAVQSITWTDSTGKPRTVSVLADNVKIIRYAYTVDGANVVDDEAPGYGIGNLVNHGDCGATSTLGGAQEYEASAGFAGANHYVWRSTLRLRMCNHQDVSWRVTSEYVFYTGHDHFIQTVSYDASDLPMSEELGDDMRGPYNQTTWPGDGSITGFGWGSEFKFRTTGPIPDGNANVGGGVAVPWEWTEPNTIPYVWEWCDRTAGAAVDREFGIVQNQPYVEQDFGGGFFGCGADCFAKTPPLTGTALPAAWAMPSQMSSYDSNYRSGRITWGQTYGTMENNHANDTGTITDMGSGFRPVNAWSWTHVVGAFTAKGVPARITDTENLYASSLSASTGTVVTEGPRGPGDFVGPMVGEMPTITWTHPGLDFIYRSWNASADEGVLAVTLDVDGGLFRPVFVVHDMGAGAPLVRLDGAELVADRDYFASFDAASDKLWLTLARDLAAGPHSLAIAGEGGTLPPDTPGGAGSGAGGGSSAGRGGSAGSTSGGASGGASAGRGGAGRSGAGASAGESGRADGGDDADAGSADGAGASDDGCSCRVARSRETSWWVWSAPFALGVTWLRTRRRRRV